MHNDLRRDGRTIYVPVADSPLRRDILPGSGIVGTPVPDTRRVLIDYEGNKYDFPHYNEYEERVRHAYDRHVWKERGYPTIARQLVPVEELLEVGFITIEDPTDEDVANELHATYGWSHPQPITVLKLMPEFKVRKRELARPRIHIDRQDVVDEWCGS